MPFNIEQKFIEGIIREKLKGFSVTDAIKFLADAFKHELDLLEGDANKNGIVDRAEVEKDLQEAFQKLSHAAGVIHEARKAS